MVARDEKLNYYTTEQVRTSKKKYYNQSISGEWGQFQLATSLFYNSEYGCGLY